jgi:hypothetical protein
MGISLFSFGEFSHFFNLKNMASTNKKDFCERKNGPIFKNFLFLYIWRMGDRQISTSVSSRQPKYKRVS